MFYAKKISDKLIIITETHSEEKIVFCMQLVIGKTRAALIDSGLKDGKELLKLIKSFTNLPVSLYLTHGHGDHSGNAHLFDEVHVSEKDGWMLGGKAGYIPLCDGKIIDLGGIMLTAYALPGHTDGGFCFLNESDGFALTGDIINRETWLCWQHCAKPKIYADRVLRFKEVLKEKGVNKIFEGHCENAADLSLCDDMITALKNLADGKVKEHKYHHTEEGREKAAFSVGQSTIIYDKEYI